MFVTEFFKTIYTVKTHPFLLHLRESGILKIIQNTENIKHKTQKVSVSFGVTTYPPEI